MTPERQAFEDAMDAYLRSLGQLTDGDVITHYIVLAASDSADSHDAFTMTPSGQGPDGHPGLPGWQMRGLLTEGLAFMDVEEDED